MKKLAILIYPDCSIQEVSNVMYLFRWHYDVKSVMVSVDEEIVVSEEGIMIKPEITVDEFNKDDYYALVLPGLSEFIPTIYNENLISFLEGFKNDNDFVIGAICAGPLLLSLAGLLEDKKFTNSLYMDMNELFTCINEKNFVEAPVVVDQNIVTAIGSATRLFAITIANTLGLKTSDYTLLEVTEDNYVKEDQVHYLDSKTLIEVKEIFEDFIK